MRHRVANMISPSQLAREGEWLTVLEASGLRVKEGWDWTAYAQFQGANAWRKHMRPSVQAFDTFMIGQGIWLQCPLKDCNMQGCYADHITSTNGSHFRNLYMRGLPFSDIVRIPVLREFVWEQKNLHGGAVRFNHLDWEVKMWKGTPPPPPVLSLIHI